MPASPTPYCIPNVVLVAPSPLTRDALRRLLANHQPSLSLYTSPEPALPLFPARPDLVVLALPDRPLARAPFLHLQVPAPLLVLTGRPFPLLAHAFLERRITGLALTADPLPTLHDAVRTTLANRLWLSPSLTHWLDRHRDHAPLTRREHEVLQSLPSGASNRELADALCLAETTVRKHLASAYRKLGVRNRTQAVTWLLEQGRV